MNRQTNEAKKTRSVPIIPRAFFPYLVKVVATDTCYPIDFETEGLLYETGDVVIAYPFRDEEGNAPKPTDDSTAIDIHTIVLPNGEELDSWKEVAEAPQCERRLISAIDMMGGADFEYGEAPFGDGGNLYAQTVQAKANLLRLLGLSYSDELKVLGIEKPPTEQVFEPAQKILSVLMQDITGDYDTPDQVPESAFVETHACYVHSRNGTSGVWEFMLNLSCTFEGDPGRLAPVIAAARAEGAAYLLIHQGT